MLDLLSSHLSLAVQDESCSRQVLGREREPIMALLLKLIDAESGNKDIGTKVAETLQTGAQYLLPEPETRLEMLLSQLPKSSDDLEKSSEGQVT